METMISLEMLNNVSEVDLVYKRKVDVRLSERPKIVSSKDCYCLFSHYWDPEKIDLLEEFKVIYLNRSNRVLYLYSVSSGGISGTVADPRLILAMALKLGACGMVLCHNHPSGSLKPSRSDEELTRKIRVAASYHDIVVLDHIILSTEGYFSFADEGVL